MASEAIQHFMKVIFFLVMSLPTKIGLTLDV